MFNSDPNNPDSLIEDIAEVGLLTTAAPLFGKASRYYNENLSDTFSNWGTKLPGSDYLVNQMNKTINTASGQLLSTEGQSLSKTMLSILMTAEEMSPLHILRTLQLSNLIQPFVELEQSNEIIHLTGRQIRGQEAYYKALLDYAQTENKNKVKRQLLVKDLTKGMFYHKGNIYGSTKTGTIDKNDLILRDARLVLGSQTNGEIHSPNHILEKFSNLIGGKLNSRELRSNPLTIVAGSSSKQFGLDWTKSTLRFAAEVGFKTLDNPLAGIEEMLHGVGVNYTGLFENKYYKAVKDRLNIGFGTNGNYDLGIRESLKISAKNIAVKGAGLYIGYELLDSTLRTISGDNGLFSKGLATGLTNVYAEGRIGFAKLWSDRFQGYKERQEQNSPGSTNLTTLMAFPLAGALLGAQSSYFGRVAVSSTQGVEKAASIYNVEKSSSLLSKIGIDAELKPMKRNALIGGLFGAALTIPFLPGALIGTSSKELEDLYSGKKEIAEKSNRYWMFGGTPWEGGNTKFFTKSLVARMNADATDKVRYGDDDTKKAMNPFLHPFSYLKDPYQFEKRNAETMPYPIWGMDVSYGGIFGKVFEKTVGQVIKPDRVNPAIFDTYETSYIQEKSPNLLSKLFHAKSEAGSALNATFFKELGDLTETNDTPVNKNLNVREKSLVRDGLMLNPSEGQYNPYKEASALTFRSAMDFTGIKGWTSTLALDSFGMDPGSVDNQLARSGEADSMARDLVNQNLGDLLGAGEFQRKILPTSSGALPDRINPIKNTSSPDWMPSDPSKFYIDFSTGNPYSKVARGEERLAGVGLEALNPELQGVDPNDYSLVWRNKILTDVARGSKEHRETREEALQAYKQGDLSKREIEILGNTLDQEQQLTQKKEFYEKPNTGFTGPIGMFQSLMWETMRRNAESPLEMLTPIRPAAKFLHQRTAIEDYIETQLGGSDAGIWTNPYSHFIKPALNKSRQSLPLGNEVFIPDEAREKYNIDEYFDKLDYLRKRKSGSNDYALSTVIGASLSGLNTKEKVLKFKAGLSDDQKDYFESFSKETNEGKRDLIRAILPEDVRRGYEQIWQNLDIANKTRQNGGSVQEAIYNNLHKQTKRLQDTYDVDLTKEEKTKARKIVSQDKDTYSQMGMSKSERIQATEDELLRFKMADKESLTYIKQRTGVPNKNFIGWDPRLQTDDIKIRTLTLGGEDLKRFGFWKKDEERLRSLSAITEESDAVFSQINAIKADMKSNRNLKRSIERTMFENGFKATNITFIPNDYGSLLVRENN